MRGFQVKTIFYSSMILPVLCLVSLSHAMVSRSITKQDQIMNQAMRAINFEDVVRSVDMLDDGSLRITFQKHSAIYTLDAVKAEGLLKRLEQSKQNKKSLKISVMPDDQKIIHVD